MKLQLSTVFLVSLGRLLKTLAHVYWKVPASLGTVSKGSYYNSYFLENANNSKRTWNGIKKIVRFKSKVTQKITKISKSSIEITDPKQIADELSSYFVNVGDQLASQIPSVNESPMNYLKCPSSSRFYFSPIIAGEIEDEISNLKTGKSTGPCGISVKILKMLCKVISKPIEIIFNASLTNQV